MKRVRELADGGVGEIYAGPKSSCCHTTSGIRSVGPKDEGGGGEYTKIRRVRKVNHNG